MNFLCIDYGIRHLGLAIATTSLAEPLKSISTDNYLSTINEIVHTYHIDQLIVGLPNGGPVGEATQEFAKQLASSLNLPVTLHDETLSSYEAKQKLVTAKHKTRSGPDHHFAAALILQDYLDHHSQPS